MRLAIQWDCSTERCKNIFLDSGSPPIAVSAGSPFPSCPISSMTICGPPRSPRSDPTEFFNPGLLRGGVLILALGVGDVAGSACIIHQHCARLHVGPDLSKTRRSATGYTNPRSIVGQCV